MAVVAPNPDPDDRYNYFLPKPNGFSITGSYWISAVDKFGVRGPWSRCSSGEIDYQIVITDHYQTIYYEDRMPWTRADTFYEIQGAEAAQVNKVQGWLYPRQAEGKNLYNNETLYLFKDEEQFDGGPAHLAKGEPKFTPWMFFETEDMSNNQGWFTLPQLPRGDIYHQGEIQIRGQSMNLT